MPNTIILAAFLICWAPLVEAQSDPGDEPIVPLEELEAGCDSGDYQACVDLGIALVRGDLPADPADEERALNLFKSACDHGMAQGCELYGALLLFGSPQIAQPERGLHVLEDTCESGWSNACALTGMVLSSDLFGVDADLARSDRAYIRGCELDDAGACQGMALSLETRGLFPMMTQEAISYYRRACLLDSDWACGKVGEHMYYRNDADRNLDQTIEMLRRGCAAEHGDSCLALSYAYRDGRGVDQDSQEAERLGARACELGAPLQCLIDRYSGDDE